MRPIAFVTSTLIGGLTVFLTGVSMFAFPPLQSFYTYAMTAGAASGVPRDAPLLWAAVVGALAYAALITVAIGDRTRTMLGGIRVGAAVGFLLWATANFMFYAISHVGNLTSTLIDPFVELVPGAVAGAVIALTLKIFDSNNWERAVIH